MNWNTIRQIEAEADALAAIAMTPDALKYSAALARQKIAAGRATPFDVAWLAATTATLESADPETLADLLLRAVETWAT